MLRMSWQALYVSSCEEARAAEATAAASAATTAATAAAAAAAAASRGAIMRQQQQQQQQQQQVRCEVHIWNESTLVCVADCLTDIFLYSVTIPVLLLMYAP
jgi:hypothetical protein